MAWRPPSRGRPARPAGPAGAAERVVGLLLLLALAAVVLGTSWGLLVVDGRPDLYLAPGRLVIESLHTWTGSPSLGSPNYDPGYLPVAAFLWLLEHLGPGPALAFRLWRLLLYVVAAFGARQLYRDVRGGQDGPAGRLTAATLYVANPYVVVAAATVPVLLPYALLPWLLVALRGAILRTRPWAWTGLFVLLFAAMSGINAGVVPVFLLLSVPVVGWDAVVREGARLRTAVLRTLGCLAGAALVSAYWVAASLAALGAGESVAASSERPEAIAAVSSYTEVLRGLGAWSLYGADAAGAFRPSFQAYVSSPPVVVASFALVVLAFVGALVSRSRVRGLGVALLAVGAVAMVGIYPPSHPPPFGTALAWAFHHLPGALAFRTTSKAGATELVGLVLLAGLAADALVPRLRDNLARSAALVGALAVLAVSVAPAVTGGLYPGGLPLPAYWRTAATDLDQRAAAGRVWFLPGETNAIYRWGRRSVDDLGPGLMDRPTLVRTTVPDAPAEATNAMAAADAAIQSGTATPEAISTWARYFAVGDVLVRNDTVWEYVGGGRPAVVSRQVTSDPGLSASALYGSPGQYTTSGSDVAAADPLSQLVEMGLPPLLRYSVNRPVGIVRTYLPGATTLVVGDDAAVNDLAGYGVLDGSGEFRLLGSMTTTAAQRELASGARVVITDTNRRRSANERRLDVTGALAAPQDALGPTRTLYGPDDQTVAEYDGISGVRASGYGSVFGPVPYGAPWLALDGDVGTAWRVGDFGSAVGNFLAVDLDGIRPVPSVRIVPADTTPVRLTRVSVRVGDVTRTVDVSHGAATATFPAGTLARTVTARILGVAGDGFNSVGIAELSIPGVTVRQSARLPLTVQRLGLAGDLASTPVDVLLSRAVQGEQEAAIVRRLDLPVARTYAVRARLSVGVVPDPAGPDSLDALEGVDPAVHVSASSQQDGSLHRPSRAFDGDRATGWQPEGNALGQWVQASFGRRTSQRVVVRVATDPSGRSGIAALRLVVDGRDLGPVPVTAGAASFAVPGGRLGEVRVQVTELSGQGPIAVNEVTLDGPAPARPDAVARACRTVATVDGRAIGVELVGPAAAMALPGGAPAVGCAGPLALTAGTHDVAATGALTLDSLYLADTLPARSGSAATAADPPAVTVLSQQPDRVAVRVAASGQPFDLMLAMSYDRRWSATVDGHDLGQPEHMDGFGPGWRVPAGPARTIVLSYGPQRVFVAGLAVSGLTVLLAVVALAIGVLARWRRRRPQSTAPAPSDPSDPSEPSGGPLVRVSWPLHTAGRPTTRTEVGGDGLRRRVLGWGAAVLVAWFFGGWLAAATVAVVGVLDLFGRARPRVVLRVALGVLLVLPFAWLAGNSERLGRATFDLVARVPWVGAAGLVALTLLCVGVALDLLASPPRTSEPPARQEPQPR